MVLRASFTYFLLVAKIVLIGGCAAISEYHEDLLIRPVLTRSVLASFTFTVNSTEAAFDTQNFRLFPRSLGEILQHAHTKELHLRFSSGRWPSQDSSGRPRGGFREGGTGAELWAWVEAESDTQANERWLTLTNALSGLFCASLNFIDSTRTLRPELSFEPTGNTFDHTSRHMHLLHGTLPGEVVCTENLTPFLKLLPCKGKAGVSSLLDGHVLFDTTWQSMAIDVRRVCSAKKQHSCVIQMESSVDMLLDMDRAKGPRNDPIPKPPPLDQVTCDTSKPYNAWGDTCYPSWDTSLPAFNLRDVFGGPIVSACPYIDQHQKGLEPVCFDVTKQRKIHVNTAGSFSERTRNKASNSANTNELKCFTIPDEYPLDFTLDEDTSSQEPPRQSSQLRVDRTLTGYGQQHGGIRIDITNLDPDNPLYISYFEPLPWFMRVFTHTLNASFLTMSTPNVEAQTSIKKMIHRPAVDRKGAGHLELLLTIPASTTLVLRYDFEKSILRYTEYPPDANRGFLIPAAVIRVLPPSKHLDTVSYIRTTPLLLYLPTPDFSMPYNVIILSSTVIALAFGNIFNLLVRRFVALDEGPPSGGKLRRLVAAQATKIKARLNKVKSKNE